MNEYEKIQDEESSFSRDTMWGDRLLNSVELVEHFLKGKVLDIGCNDGLGMERIQQLGHEVVGIDISKAKVEVAKRNGLNAMVGRMEELPFEDDEFGTVFCAHTLEHAEDLAKAVSEIRRVAPRAIIFVPIEPRYRVTMLQMAGIAPNKAHYSTVESKWVLRDLFPGTVVYEEELERYEPEYLLVVDHDK